ncbi:MAG TPA: prolyl oligopeptidase family serine peptidase [Patescibacteria group bacterium]|nr:prolyl oligopeptidase family serine peptidase [Patescibacteria group bacterium]
MKKFSSLLININGISGVLYKVEKRNTDRLVIYAIGAPAIPDNGQLSDAPFILDFDVDLFAPDYIGFGRSDGSFTPQNCIKTFLQLYKDFKNGCIAKNGYLNLEFSMQYKEVLFIGRSFGGLYLSWLPKYLPEINNLCFIFPILDFVECGKIKGEETPDRFFRAMNEDGYSHLYRGINLMVWKRHFNNEDGLCPMKSVSHLAKTKVFIAHGKNDKNINVRHSIKYHRLLQKTFPKNKEQFKLKIYNGDHSFLTSNKAVVDYLKWIGIRKSK